jgi:fumarylacetoacetate (FAA) hydrolase family protein
MNEEYRMKPEDQEPSKTDAANTVGRARKPYERPVLVRYGDVKDLTQGAGTTMNEGSPGSMMT